MCSRSGRSMCCHGLAWHAHAAALGAPTSRVLGCLLRPTRSKQGTGRGVPALLLCCSALAHRFHMFLQTELAQTMAITRTCPELHWKP